MDVLAQLGFEPHKGAEGEIFLANCPFDSLSKAEPDVVCVANEALVCGVLDGLDANGWSHRSSLRRRGTG
jgi:predicted ArsR family transcriptional regulator